MARQSGRHVMGTLMLLAAAVVVLVACTGSQDGAAGGDPALDAGDEAPATSPDPTDGPDGSQADTGGAAAMPSDEPANRFDVEQVKVGDQIAGMRLEAISANGDPTHPPDPDFPSVTARFSGQVTLSGRFEHLPPDDEFFPDVVCFFPDEASVAHLPVMDGDERTIYFCFENVETARELFGGPGSGTAVVTIDDYTINRYPSEVVNTATLVELIEIQR